MKIVAFDKLFCAATLALGLWTPMRAADDEPHHKMTVGDEVLVTATAKVQAVNLEKRELTLKGPLGDVSTVTVDQAVKRLDEIKAGDEVTAKYYVSIAAELREATDEEKEHPIMIVEGTTKAPKGAAPAAGQLNVLKVVATVEGLERPTRLLTLKGPRGNYLTVRARDAKRLEKLHLGDTIVVTFTEALAISVEKVGKAD